MSGNAKGSEAPAAGSPAEQRLGACGKLATPHMAGWYCHDWIPLAEGNAPLAAPPEALPVAPSVTPPDARVKELEGALRDELSAVLGEAQRVLGGEPWDLRFGLFARIDAARRSLLGASDPSPSEGAAPHASSLEAEVAVPLKEQK